MKQYIITDPCYLIQDNWSEICFDNNKIEDELSKTSGEKAYVHDTLIGDWSNEIIGKNVIRSGFCADAGLVCVCLFNEKIKTLTKNLPLWCYALFETEELKSVEFIKTSPDWIVVKVETKEGIITSMSDDELEEDYE